MKHNILSIISVAVLSFVSLASFADSVRTISITATNKVDGLAKSLSISLGETSVTNTLFVVYGETDHGDDIDAWTHIDPICIATPETNNIVYTLPENWGSDTMCIRFFLAKGVVQPYDYEVEYLNTTGNQCINFPPLTFTYLTTRLMQSVAVTKRMFIMGTGSYCWYDIKATGKFMNGTVVPIGESFSWTITNINDVGHVYINGVDSGDIEGNSTERYKLFHGVNAFCVGGNPGYNPIIGGIHKTTIYDGLKPVANAIPVMTNGVACFYDTVRRVYYRQDGYTSGGEVVGFIRDQDNRVLVSSTPTYRSEIPMIVLSTLEEPTGMVPPLGVCTEVGDFMAPAISEVGNYRYTCNGYTLEEYSNGEWRVVETSSALLYSCPDDGVPRRMTWNWELTHYKVDFASSPTANGSTILEPDIEDRFYPINTKLTLTPQPNEGAYHTGYYIVSQKMVIPGSEYTLYHAYREGPITITLECPKTIRSYYASSWGFNGSQITNGVWTFTFGDYSTGIKLTKYNGGYGKIDFRRFEEDTGKKVLAISEALFYMHYNKSPTSLFAPDVYVLGGRLFHSCYKIGHVEISSNLTSLESLVFYRCTSLTNLTPTILPKVSHIGKQAFDGGTPVRGDFEFASCKSIAASGLNAIGATSIKLPACTTIEGNAIRGCKSLTNVVINASTLSGEYHFYNDTALKTISFTNPDGVATFPNYAFQSCNALTDIWYYGTNAPSSVGTKTFNLTAPYPHIHIRDNKDLEGWRALATRLADPTGTSLSALTASDKARTDYPGIVRTVGFRAASNNYFWIVKWPVNISTFFIVR